MKKNKMAKIAKIKRGKKKSSAKAEIPVQPAQSVSIIYTPVPPLIAPGKKIHKRMPLPKLPATKHVPDSNPSTASDI